MVNCTGTWLNRVRPSRGRLNSALTYMEHSLAGLSQATTSKGVQSGPLERRSGFRGTIIGPISGDSATTRISIRFVLTFAWFHSLELGRDLTTRTNPLKSTVNFPLTVNRQPSTVNRQ